MNLNGRSSLDPRWTDHHVTAVEGFMLAAIKIIRRNPMSPATYNQETGEWTGDFNEIWSGNARIQPYGIIGDMTIAQDPAGRRLMRVQIADKVTGINLDDQIIVTACEEAPELVLFDIEVRGTISSSNAWITDLVAEANMKHNG